MTTVALVGAGGKMGCRITDNMKKQDAYRMLHVEVADAGRQRLGERGVAPVAAEEALPAADLVVLAVPDNRIETISKALTPQMKDGALLVCLDPAAPCAGRVVVRPEAPCFVVHPCHPPVFGDETDPEARRDFFGGVSAKQHIVCALVQGTDDDYARGEALARVMFAPIIDAHRVTVEQMAILEPALAETTSAPAIMMIKEGLDEAIRRGVPAEAARAFLMGHINVQLAITFGETEARYSDGALKMLREAQGKLFQPDWKKVFEPESVRAQLESILKPPSD
jgi:hypothetical protein